MSGYPIDLRLKHSTLDAFKADKIPVDTTYFDNTGSLVTPKSIITQQGNTFNGANQLVKLDSNGKLPAIDISNAINVASGIPSLFKTGLNISNNTTTPNTKIDIATGKCRSIQDNYDLILSSSQTLDITSTTDRGGSLTSGAFYRVFLISNGTITKTWANIETDTSMANLPSGYTHYRRIGAIQYIDSTSGIRKFTQWMNRVLWTTPFFEVNTTDTTFTDSSLTLVAPNNISIAALLGASVGNNAVNAYPTLSVKSKNGTTFIDISSGNVGGSSIGTTAIPITSKDKQVLFSFGGQSYRFGKITNYGFEDYFID